MQKFIFTERVFRDTASLFIKNEIHLTSYLALRKSLVKEFVHVTSPAQIHEILATSKCKPKEKLCKYFLIVKEIAQRGNVDDSSLMHYVFNGIQDTPKNKAILFGCLVLL